MPSSFQTTRRVEFADTDMAGIVHFASFFRYMEETEHAYLRSLGLSVVFREGQEEFGWPRVSASCDYRGPARFEDVLDIQMIVARKGTSSITYQFNITLEGRPVAEGKLTAVFCRLGGGVPPKAMPLPDWISQKIEVAPSTATS